MKEMSTSVFPIPAQPLVCKNVYNWKTATIAYANLDGWVEIVKPNEISAKAILVKMVASAGTKRVLIIAPAHQVSLARIAISMAPHAIATLVSMEAPASIVAMERNFIVSVLLAPLEKHANKTPEMSVPIILAKTGNALTV